MDQGGGLGAKADGIVNLAKIFFPNISLQWAFSTMKKGLKNVSGPEKHWKRMKGVFWKEKTFQKER